MVTMCAKFASIMFYIPTSEIPAHIEKMALPTSKSVGNIGFSLHFHMIFLFMNFRGGESKF